MDSAQVLSMRRSAPEDEDGKQINDDEGKQRIDVSP